MADWQKQNDNSYRLASDSLPILLPSWAQPIYQYGIKPSMETSAANAKPAKKKAKARTREDQLSARAQFQFDATGLHARADQPAAAPLAGGGLASGDSSCSSARLIAISRVGEAILAPSRSVT